ncbi:uncharacterized protein PHACADRAFT_252094 [Phanerochaete carnosa HHB-10118-sp]|uniref:Uncharacterized protein n=1 Tax=Phanerochaete carnosa (strain HHB-10118-sp) TaxID=650164 RepID=K5W2J0_PHACS|nr:uncharacterized protein PHACADRAFT_252094 [Phanerochaete carnosa HHB-10118-sp]EKM58088.1 hypothetical protein PHACADRAFT_252094 [Phanerochaete carnosa HHB-10118-sp]
MQTSNEIRADQAYQRGLVKVYSFTLCIILQWVSPQRFRLRIHFRLSGAGAYDA